MWRRFRSAWQLWTRNSEFESELDADIAAHLAEHEEALKAAGMSPDEARRCARADFGPAATVRQECREATAFSIAAAFVRDLRYGFRLLHRSPGFAAVAVVTLALCIGANTAVFSIVDAVLFRPLGYPEPARLAEIAIADGDQATAEEASFNGTQWESVHAGTPALETAVFSDWGTNVNIVSAGAAATLKQQRVGLGFFHVLGVPPFMGREFHADEDRKGGPPAAILSYPAWKTTFGGDTNILGRSILIRGGPHTVVGVMPDGFRSTIPAEVWTPLRPSRDGEGSGENYGILARLKPGATWAQANLQLDVLHTTMFGASAPREHARIAPLQTILAGSLRRPLLILWGSVGLVLLIGCINLAGLLLARASVRSSEIATRMAVGGGGGPILRQLTAEAVALGLYGAAAGVLAGAMMLTGLRNLGATLSLPFDIRIDARVLVVTLAIALGAAILFSLYPALRLSRLPLSAALAESGTRIAGGRRHWTRRVLVLTEVCLSVILLFSAALLIRSFTYLRTNARGFQADGLTTGTVSLEDSRYQKASSVTHLFDATLERIRTYQGVEGAAVALTLPYERPLNIGIHTRDNRNPTINLVYVSPEFFRVLQTPLLRGRYFTPADSATSAKVMIVNEAFLANVFRGKQALGESLRVFGSDVTVVGVAGNIVQRPGFGGSMPVDVTPTAYIPTAQITDRMVGIHIWFSPSFVVRSGDHSVAAQAMRASLAGVDRYLPLGRVRTFDTIADETLAMQRFEAALMAALAALALLLAAVGLGGLIATNVSERRREIGIRMALGATRANAIITASVPGIGLSAAGLTAGALAAPLAATVLRRFIWGVAPADPATLATVLAILLVTSVIASVVPALRIARIQVASILRQ
jgi:predicted permease